jgi:multidrug efflux pump subunit AcrB
LQIAVPGAADLPDAQLVFRLTITPVLIKWWLFKNAPSAEAPKEKADPYRGRFYRGYQQTLRILLQQKTLTLVLMGALLAGAIWGFTFVGRIFSVIDTPIFFVDLWLPYGTDINATEQMTRDIERSINSQPGVATTVSIGQGSMRFILTYSGQRQYSNYAQIMVRMDDQRSIAPVTRHVEAWIAETTRR